MNDRQKRPNLLDELAADAPIERMRSRFSALLAEGLPNSRRPGIWLSWAAAAMLLIVVSVVVRQRPPAITRAENQAQAVLESLRAPSTFERLRGVNRAARGLDASPALTEALLERLTEDSSISVRLSALDALLGQPETALEPSRIAAAMAAQETAIVQAHLGHQLLRTRALSRTELEQLIEKTGVHADARRAILQKEKS